MKASEANELAKNKKPDDFENILRCIKQEAEGGKFVLYRYAFLESGTERKLRELGYHVSSSFGRNEILVTIRWD